MRLSIKALKQMLVQTSMGEKIGHVSDVILETEGQMIAQYEVKPSIISSKNYLISREQIIRFEEKKIIVDNNVKQKSETIEVQPPLEADMEPAT